VPLGNLTDQSRAEIRCAVQGQSAKHRSFDLMGQGTEGRIPAGGEQPPLDGPMGDPPTGWQELRHPVDVSRTARSLLEHDWGAESDTAREVVEAFPGHVSDHEQATEAVPDKLDASCASLISDGLDGGVDIVGHNVIEVEAVGLSGGLCIRVPSVAHDKYMEACGVEGFDQ